jgi:hypothetical protein
MEAEGGEHGECDGSGIKLSRGEGGAPSRRSLSIHGVVSFWHADCLAVSDGCQERAMHCTAAASVLI